MQKKICVIGLGYIGLPTSLMFASSGNQVIGVDVNSNVVDTLNEGKIHIEEPRLQELYEKVLEDKMFYAKMKPVEADAFIIAVPTPNKEEDKSCDLSYVIGAVKSIKEYLKKGNTIIIESTIGPRTIDDYIAPIIEGWGFKIGEEVYLAHCPERVLPGKIIEEMVFNNRIVGGFSEECASKAECLYRSFVKGEIIKTNAKTAEMAKLMENTFRDVNIALANELAKVCNSLEINVLDVIRMANKHPRVNIHEPGPGVGGHCLAVDPYFIVEKAPELSRIISLSREINCSMPNYVVHNVRNMLKDIENPKVAVFGITYKGNIDDIRESPALKIIELLRKDHYRISIHDPHVKLRNIPLTSGEKAAEAADLLLILADHDEFKNEQIKEYIKNMRTPIIFDTKNILKYWDLSDEKKMSGFIIKNMGNIH